MCNIFQFYCHSGNFGCLCMDCMVFDNGFHIFVGTNSDFRTNQITHEQTAFILYSVNNPLPPLESCQGSGLRKFSIDFVLNRAIFTLPGGRLLLPGGWFLLPGGRFRHGAFQQALVVGVLRSSPSLWDKVKNLSYITLFWHRSQISETVLLSLYNKLFSIPPMEKRKFRCIDCWDSLYIVLLSLFNQIQNCLVILCFHRFNQLIVLLIHAFDIVYTLSWYFHNQLPTCTVVNCLVKGEFGGEKSHRIWLYSFLLFVRFMGEIGRKRKFKFYVNGVPTVNPPSNLFLSREYETF